VWDYPRPPRIEQDWREVLVKHADTLLAQSTRALRVLETASPPTFYLPPGDVRLDRMQPASGSSLCEWKGQARSWSVALPDTRLRNAAWSYEDPYPQFADLAGYLAFYPALVECYVDGDRVQPQSGGLYGGWITPEIVGPFKGEPGTESW